jgi:hypothetical protein
LRLDRTATVEPPLVVGADRSTDGSLSPKLAVTLSDRDPTTGATADGTGRYRPQVNW